MTSDTRVDGQSLAGGGGSATPMDSHTPLDGELLRRFREHGDREALSQFLERHRMLAFRVARGVLGEPADAEDAVQDAFLSLIAYAPRVRGEGPLGSLIARMALRSAQRLARAAGRRRVRETTWAAESGGGAGTLPDPADDELAAEVRDAAQRLHDRYRLPIVLHYFEGLSTQETADALGITQTAVTTRLSRAVGKLRGQLTGTAKALPAATLVGLLARGQAGAEPATLAMRLGELAANAAVPPVAPLTTSLAYLAASTTKAKVVTAALAATVAVGGGVGVQHVRTARLHVDPVVAGGRAPDTHLPLRGGEQRAAVGLGPTGVPGPVAVGGASTPGSPLQAAGGPRVAVPDGSVPGIALSRMAGGRLVAIMPGQADATPYTESARDGKTCVSGTIRDSVRWERARSPYLLVGSVLVAPDGELTIEPGVVVQADRPSGARPFRDQGIGLRVWGTLVARGRPDARIRFTPASESPSRQGGEWEGIDLAGLAPSVLTWAVVEHARSGIQANGGGLIAHNVVRWCHTGIWLNEQFAGDVFHNVLQHCSATGIRCRGTGQAATIRDNICHETGTGIDAWGGAVPYADYNLLPLERPGGGWGGPRRGLAPGPHDVLGDPQFVDSEASDFRLGAASPAKGRGSGGSNIGLDIEGWSEAAAEKEVERWLAGGARAAWYDGMLAAWRGQPGARDAFAKALGQRLDPELHTLVSCSLGETLVRAGQAEEAQQVLRKAPKGAPSPHLRDLARRRLAEALGSAGRPAEALALVRSVEWPQSKVWVGPDRALYAALAGQVKESLAAIEDLKAEDPSAYLRTLVRIVGALSDAGKTETATALMGAFSAFPDCPEIGPASLRLGQALRGQNRPTQAADVLRSGLAADPLGREAPALLALLAAIVRDDLHRPKDADAAALRLATAYFAGIPEVAQARSALGAKLAEPPRKRRILLDESLGESSVHDRQATGSCNVGQYEVARTLVEKGYLVHTNGRGPRGALTDEVLKGYGLVVLNGRYGGDAEPPIPAPVIECLVRFVEDGGSLLVNGAGSAVGAGRTARYYDPLLRRFGLRFDEGTGVKHGGTGQPENVLARQGAGEFRVYWPALVRGGVELGTCEDGPVLAAARHGQGMVIASGLGGGLWGTVMNPRGPDGSGAAESNRRLLLALAGYALGEQPHPDLVAEAAGRWAPKPPEENGSGPGAPARRPGASGTAPAVLDARISQPAEGTQVSGTITLKADLVRPRRDFAVGLMTFYAGDQKVADVCPGATEVKWDSRQVADGSHALTVQLHGYDRAAKKPTDVIHTSKPVWIHVSNSGQ